MTLLRETIKKFNHIKKEITIGDTEDFFLQMSLAVGTTDKRSAGDEKSTSVTEDD